MDVVDDFVEICFDLIEVGFDFGWCGLVGVVEGG